MPMLRGKFVNDMTKPWKLACWGQHEWDSRSCPTRCGKWAKIAEGGMFYSGIKGRTEMLHLADASEIFETKVQLNATDTLQKASRERIASHQNEWRPLLGLEEGAKKRKKRTKKPTK